MKVTNMTRKFSLRDREVTTNISTAKIVKFQGAMFLMGPLNGSSVGESSAATV